MSVVAKLYATLGLDAREFDTGMKKRETTLQQFGQAVVRGVGFGAGLSVFNTLKRGVEFVKEGFEDVVTAASNMTETQTKLDQVFMTSADTIRMWASDSAQSMIMSEQAALSSAASFGNFLQALGVGEEKSAEMSMGLTQLAADLASYNNLAGGAEEATMRLFSGMSGEMEAVRRLGIDLSETAVTTYLLEHGVKRVGMQFRQSDKTMARYALIMKDTAKAQGDVERTGGNLANRQRELNAEVGNLQAVLGAGLVGPMADFTGWLADLVGFFTGNTSLNMKFDDFIEKQFKLKDAIKEVNDEAAKNSGLGMFEDLVADLPGLDLVAPHIARAVRQWRIHHVELTKAGFDLYTFAGKLDDLTGTYGQTEDAAMETILAFGKQDEAVRKLSASLAKNARDDEEWAASFDRSAANLRDVLSGPQLNLGKMLGDLANEVIDGGKPVADAFDSVFDDAVKEIVKGFGGVKKALEGPTGIIDPAKRLENMQNRLRQATANLRLAQQVGDPRGIRKWTLGVARAQQILDQFKGDTASTTQETIKHLDAMGVDGAKVFHDLERDVKRDSKDTADAAIRQARRAARQVEAAFQGLAPQAHQWGADVTRAFAAGLASKAALKAIENNATTVMASIQDFMRTGSPTKKGPGSRGGGPEGWGETWGYLFGKGLGNTRLDSMLTASMTPHVPAGAMAGGGRGDGGGIHIHVGNVYGGPAGLRQLAGDIERAVRPTRRERRRVHLAEG